MALIDMKRDKADETSEMAAMPADNEGQYPYGLCISLDKDELDKLGITSLPPIGAEFHLVAVGQVTRINQSADKNMDEERSMSIQITMMEAKYEPPHPGEEKETATDEQRETKTLLGSY